MGVLVARTERDLEEAYGLLANCSAVGCDTETSGLHPSKGRLLSIQFSDGATHVLVPVSEGVSAGPLAGLLEDASTTVIFHNARFDLAFLSAAGLNAANVFDTMIAEKVLTKGAGQSVSLSETLYRYFAVDLDKAHRKKFGRNWNGVWTDDLVRYATEDVAYLPDLMREQIDWLAKLGLRKDYEALFGRMVG